MHTAVDFHTAMHFIDTIIDFHTTYYRLFSHILLKITTHTCLNHHKTTHITDVYAQDIMLELYVDMCGNMYTQ